MEKQIKYSHNEAKFQEISKQFSQLSDAFFYSTQIKIAAEEYVKFLNELVTSGHNVVNVTLGISSNTLFAIRVGEKYIVNDKKVKKCIEKAYKKREFLLFGFCKVNVVLDRLREELKAHVEKH